MRERLKRKGHGVDRVGRSIGVGIENAVFLDLLVSCAQSHELLLVKRNGLDMPRLLARLPACLGRELTCGHVAVGGEQLALELVQRGIAFRHETLPDLGGPREAHNIGAREPAVEEPVVLEGVRLGDVVKRADGEEVVEERGGGGAVRDRATVEDVGGRVVGRI